MLGYILGVNLTIVPNVPWPGVTFIRFSARQHIWRARYGIARPSVRPSVTRVD